MVYSFEHIFEHIILYGPMRIKTYCCVVYSFEHIFEHIILYGRMRITSQEIMSTEKVLPGFEHPLSFRYDPPPLEELDSYSFDPVSNKKGLERKEQDITFLI